MSAASSSTKPPKPKFWDKVKGKMHIGGDPKSPRKEVDLQEEARRTFAPPPNGSSSRRHSVDVPGRETSSYSVNSTDLPAPIPLPSEQERSIGSKSGAPDPLRLSLPVPLAKSPSTSNAAFKPLMERRNTGSSTLPISSASFSIDSPAPPRAVDRMPPPVATLSTSYQPAASIMLPATSFTPAPRAYGGEPAAIISDADIGRMRRYSVPTVPVGSQIPTQPSIPSPRSPSTLPAMPSQSTPQLRGSTSISLTNSTGGSRISEVKATEEPRLRLIPSPRASPSPPLPSAAHDRTKRDKHVWKQKIQAVNSQIYHTAATKRAAYDATAEERAVTVQRALKERRRASVSDSTSSSSSPPTLPASTAAFPVPEAAHRVVVPVPRGSAPHFYDRPLQWLWLVLSYAVFGLQLLSIAIKETSEALATGTLALQLAV